MIRLISSNNDVLTSGHDTLAIIRYIHSSIQTKQRSIFEMIKSSHIFESIFEVIETQGIAHDNAITSSIYAMMDTIQTVGLESTIITCQC